MQELSAEQEKQIEALAKSESDLAIAKKLRLDRNRVQAHLQAVGRRRRQRRERVFRAVMAATPVLFFLGGELALRLFNYGGDLSLFAPADALPGFMKVNSTVGRRYFASTAITPETSHDVFRAEKAFNAYRVFVMGGSTAAGYPYMYNGSMSKMLFQRLLDYFPDREIEVVNLAMPAINSFSLLDFTSEALAQMPDALIIYCGHNEFYGALGVGSTESLGRWRWVINRYLHLQRLKIMLFLRDQLETLKKWLRPAAAREGSSGSTLMEQMVAEEQIPFQGEVYQRARRFFTANLRDVLAAARRKGVRVILSNLVSNIRDQAPFVSIYAPTTDRRAFASAIERASRLVDAGNAVGALALYDSLLVVDASPAILHFLRGRCLEAMGNISSARLAYRRARDLDGLRFRASADFNMAIQEVAQTTGEVLVDMEAAFEQASSNGLVGKNLMLEHLHPNVEGYFIMGRELCRAMRANGFVSPTWDEARAQPEQVYWQKRGVTALDEEIARIRIEVLTRNWPFVPTRGREAPLVYHPRTYLEKLAYAAWKREETWEKAHVLLAEDYAQRGQPDLAINEYEALVLQTPYNASPYLRAGLLYTAVKDYNRAYDRLTKALALEPSAEAYKVVGAILISRQQPAEGVPYLQKALQLVPTDGQTLYNLTGAYLLLGQTDDARSTLARLEKLMPGSAKVEQLKRGLADAQSEVKGNAAGANGARP